jgi:spore maturation protein CgeB
VNVLYVGDAASWSTSRHRADALQRLGHAVTIVDPGKSVSKLRKWGIARKFHDLTGQACLLGVVHKGLKSHVNALSQKPDLVWIDGGELISRRSLGLLKALTSYVVLYNVDDPTGERDANRFRQVKVCLPFYDLCVTVRQPTAVDMANLGAKRVLHVCRSYDEIEHRPIDSRESAAPDFTTDVVFVGTYMRNEAREKILRVLHEDGLKLSIWGGRWEKCADKELVATCWKSRPIVGREYVHAVAGAKIALGMVSKGNRDEHTQRSLEIPYAGGLLCAERTSEHTSMFKEGHEAVFWDSPEECIRVCRGLLLNEDKRRAIVAAGMRRVRELKVGNEDICRKILSEVFA